MPATNKPRWVVFKGRHAYFEDGVPYTYAMYSDWTIENNEDGGVIRSTMKGRLGAVYYCEPKHLMSVKTFKEKAKKRVLSGFCKKKDDNKIIKIKPVSLSSQWLRKKL